MKFKKNKRNLKQRKKTGAFQAPVEAGLIVEFWRGCIQQSKFVYKVTKKKNTVPVNGSNIIAKTGQNLKLQSDRK